MPERAAGPTPAPAPVAAPPQQAPRRTSAPPERLSSQPLTTPPAGLPPAVGRLLAAPGTGHPLPTTVQAPIAQRLGVDARAVRVHEGPAAAAAAVAVGARAFAYGTHIFLGPGQKPTDLGLMAHEVAHVVQQQGGRASVQRAAFAGAADGLELEARAVGAAVARGESARVAGRAGGARVQRWGLSDIGGAIVSGVKAIGSAIADLGSAAINAALDFIKDKAKSIPGYDLLSFILGKDPITQKAVDRTAMNLVRALVALIPGGAAMFENIEKAGVLQKIADWFGTEVEKLDLSWAKIRALFQQAWDALSASDILSPSTAWEKIKKIFGPPVARLVDFAKSAGKKLLEFIFEGAIALGGGAAQQVLGFFRRIQSVFALIVGDPVKFLSNLIAAAKGGFEKFAKNVVEHLKKALFNWLFGALAGALKLPAKFDFMGIIDIVLQVLGLTYDRFRERLVKLLGEPAVKFIETAFDFLKTLVTKGIAAAWEKLIEFATGMIDTVIAMIRDWVVKTIVGKAVLKLVSMFNPVGAIIQSIIAIYDTVMFFIEKAKEVMVLLNAIIDSIENIAKGNIAGAVAYVENMLASALVVIINFLARFAGLSKIADAIKDTIKKIQDTVWKAIDKAIDWVKDKVKDLLGPKDKPDAAAAAAPAAVGLPEKSFKVGAASHKVWIKKEGANEIVMVQSDPQPLEVLLNKAEASKIPEDQKKHAKFARDILAKIKPLADKIAEGKLVEPALGKARTEVQDLETELALSLQILLEDVDLKTFNEIYALEGIVAPYDSVPTQKSDLMTPDHQPQAAILKYAAAIKNQAGEAIFAGTVLEDAARGHAVGAMTINLHENRHRAGRTWGYKSRSTLPPAKAAIDAAVKSGTAPQQRDAVIVALRGELDQDVSAMNNVAGNTTDAKVWKDILDSKLKPEEKAPLIGRISGQITTGESKIKGQNLDRLKQKK